MLNYFASLQVRRPLWLADEIEAVEGAEKKGRRKSESLEALICLKQLPLTELIIELMNSADYFINI